MHRRSRFAALGVAAALVVALAPVTPAAAAAPSVAPAATTPAGSVATVTLVTGDRVVLQQFPGGRQVASVEPRDDGPTGYAQLEIDGDLHIVPTDAMPYLTSGSVDWDLFNITELVEQRYDDAHRRSIPLIASYDTGVRPSEARAPRGSKAGAVLESIRGRALAADKRQAATFWEAIDDDRGGATPRLAGGIAKLWLDGRVTASLDRSVPQIGAPEVWRSGYDGTGVTVAVLDTGVDAEHPALAGKIAEARNFSPSDSTTDRFGHGTHVASIIAGSGTGSDRKRSGVAPGARLLVGKVLDDYGYGSTSAVLDGMEWAAASGADIVNMSLGGGTSDGTDPLSVAVDRLTARYHTLFVVSAGNDGPGDYTVNAPGSADSALTVGAVDRDGRLADFSSRGPRVGDLGLKPDITAPGVDIVAARAAGTTMGIPVGEHYVAASGTSMAAPHVAGAAALLAQQNPKWVPARLKDALVSTAKVDPDQTAYETGGGLVDVARASAQKVYATGSVRFGNASDGGTDRAEVAYRNPTDQPVTLKLSAELRTADGTRAPADVLGFDDTVRVAPGETVKMPLTLYGSDLPTGHFGGHLTAATSDGTVQVHTTLGVVKDPPRRKVTVTGLNRAGEPTDLLPFLLFGTDRRYDLIANVPRTGFTFSLPEGRYFMHAVITERRSDGEQISVVLNPELDIRGDTTIVVDGRDANPVEIRTPKPAVNEGLFSFYTHRAFGARKIWNGHMALGAVRRLYVTPTRAPADGTFEFASRWELVAPRVTASAVTTDGEYDLDPAILHRSPAIDDPARLPLVDAGAGNADDYTGLDVAGKAVLADALDPSDEDRVRTAAEAGASVAVLVLPPGELAWSKWQVKGERLPIPAVMVRHEEGQRLRESLATGDVTFRLDGTSASPYLYDIMQVSRQSVPEQVVYEVSAENTAKLVTRYHDTGGFPYAKEQRFGWRPWLPTALNQIQRWVRTPSVREEYVSADDTLWEHVVHHRFTYDSWNELYPGMTQAPQRYTAGDELTESWFAPVSRPGIPSGVPGLISYRRYDRLTVQIPEFGDANPGHYGYADGGDWGGAAPDDITASLYQDGELVAEQPTAWFRHSVDRPGSAFRLDLSVARTTPEWRCSVRSQTSWTFTAPRPADDQPVLLPLLQLDYAVATDLYGAAPAGKEFSFDVSARHQDGLTGRSVTGMEVAISYDDGETWRDAALSDRGDGRYRVTVTHPDSPDGFVSLRVRATDDAGNSVTQTVIRAYGLR